MTDSPHSVAATVDDGASAPAARRWPLWARTPLGVKLIVALLSLSALGLLVRRLAAGAVLHSYLFQRTDTQLDNAANRFVAQIEAGQAPELRLNPGDGPTQFYIAAYDFAGVLKAETRLSGGQRPAISGRPVRDIADGLNPHTVKAESGALRWRVVERVFRDGSGSAAVGIRLDDVDDTLGHLRLINLVVGLGVLVILGGLAYGVVRSSLRPLREVELTAAAIATGHLSQRVPDADPNTEVGRLSGALNGMLAQIEAAFRAQANSEAQARASEERMRRFVADASHELRTPLTSIRGFAELFRQGAVTDPQDLQRLMRRVEDEAAGMGLLVEDLLLLARLDQQRPIERRPVDLLSIAADAVHDARAVQPQRQLTLVPAPSDVPPVVWGDDARLRQVVGNLVTNALTHTPQDARISVTVAVVNGFAEIAVSDDGPGLAPDDAARIFERFYRADASRTRAHGGSGLGLSIVAALVAAHGGTVDVDTRQGVGTTFRVRLPLADVGAGMSAPPA